MSLKLAEFRGVSVDYDGSRVLEDVGLSVWRDDFLGVIGPNGGGKTTLVKALLGLVPLSEGEILFYDSEGKPTDSINIGYLPQYSSFDFNFPITVKEVVLTGFLSQKSLFYRYNKEQKREADNLLKLFGLSHLAARPIGSLSGGQRQKVLMARALANKPELLILDEPSTYIDKESEGQMYRMLEKISSQCAVILVSHDVGTVIQMVRNIACVNRKLHYHPASEPAHDWIEHELGCPLELVAHGHLPHRVLSAH